MMSLDARPDDAALVSGLLAGAIGAELAGFASSMAGCPVVLSPRLEVRDDDGGTGVAYYVTPAGGA
jgi:hypothetical protein